MELGRVNLRKNRVNVLYSALHDRHGLIWTDGTGIYLSPVNIEDNELASSPCVKLGEFDYISSLSWSCDVGQQLCYLSVVHSENVAIWSAQGVLPELHLKQVFKIDVVPIPQGCLWNPNNRTTLCILSLNQIHFYDHEKEVTSKLSLPCLESETIACGTWSADGNKLLVAIGSLLRIYCWNDISRSLEDHHVISWRIPSVDASIVAIETVDNMYACTTELPLDTLCIKGAEDVYVTPECNRSEDSRRKDIDIITSSTMGDEGIIGTLLSIPQPQENNLACSKLILFTCDVEPCQISAINILGILKPDLLCYNRDLQGLIVGSNIYSKLEVFSTEKGSLVKTLTITLTENYKPKGLCPMINPPGMLIAEGKQISGNTLFPSGKNEEFELRLTFKPFISNTDQVTFNAASPNLCELPKPTIRTTAEVLNSRSKIQVLNCSSSGDDLELESSDFNSTPCNFDNQVVKTMKEMRSDIIQSQTEDRTFNLTSCQMSENSIQTKAAVIEDTDSDIEKNEVPVSISVDIVSPENIEEDLNYVVINDQRVIKRRHVHQNIDSVITVVDVHCCSENHDKETFLGECKIPCTDSDLVVSGNNASSCGTDDSSDLAIQTEMSLTIQGQSDCEILPDVINQKSLVPSMNENSVDRNITSNEIIHTCNHTGFKGNRALPCDTQTDIENIPENDSEDTGGNDGNILNGAEAIGMQDRDSYKSMQDSGEIFQNISEKGEIPNNNNRTLSGRKMEPVSVDQSNFAPHNSNNTNTQHNISCHVVCQNNGIVRKTLTEKEALIKTDEKRNFSSPPSGYASGADALANVKCKGKEADDAVDDVLAQVAIHGHQLTQLRRYVDKLNRVMEETSLIEESRYQHLATVETVTVVYCTSDEIQKKVFLLDSGRIKLEEIKEIFNLAVVEIILEGEPVVVGANIDGYIPIKFDPGTVIRITGKQKS